MAPAARKGQHKGRNYARLALVGILPAVAMAAADLDRWPGDWKDHAACAGVDLRVFFPDGIGGSAARLDRARGARGPRVVRWMTESLPSLDPVHYPRRSTAPTTGRGSGKTSQAQGLGWRQRPPQRR